MSFMIDPYLYAVSGIIAEVPLRRRAPAFVAATSVQGSSASANRAWPAGHQANDIGFLIIQTANEATPATPVGWNAFPVSPGTGTPGAKPATKLNIFWKRATSSAEPAVPTGDAGLFNNHMMIVFRGCRTAGAPFEAYADAIDIDNDNATTMPAVTTAGTDRRIFYVMGPSRDGVASNTLTSVTNANLVHVGEHSDGTTGGGGVCTASGVAPAAGDVGTASVVLNSPGRLALVTMALVAEPEIGSPPIYLSSTLSQSAVDNVNHNVFMPARVDAGDLLIAQIATDDTATITATPAGWTFMATIAPTTTINHRAHYYYRIADGTEDGSSYNFVTTVAEAFAALVHRVKAGTYSGTPEIAVVGDTSLGNVNPDPPSLTPSWGAADTLWIATFATDNENNIVSSPLPFNVAESTLTLGTARPYVGSCYQEINTATLNPGAFTKAGNQRWSAATIAVRPA